MKDRRWTRKKTIKRKLIPYRDNHAGGNIIYRDGSQAWKYTGSGHILYLGITGSGKTCSGIIPTVLDLKAAEESVVVTDPKGDIFEATSGYNSDKYIQYVIDFRNLYESDGYDPLHIIWEFYKTKEHEKIQLASKMLYDLACALYPFENQNDVGDTRFWVCSARDLFMGVVYALMDEGDPDKINMMSVHHMVTAGEERFGGKTFLQDYVHRLIPNSNAAMLMRSYVDTASDTRGGIRSVYLNGLSMFIRDKGIMSMFSAEGLKIEELDGKKPTIIYIILPDESKNYHDLCGVLVNQLMKYYSHIAREYPCHRLPVRVNMILEELGNIGGAIDSLSQIISAGRSRNIRCHLVLQSLSQLNAIYGSCEAATIIENTSALVAFRTNNWDTLTELSNKCGTWELECNGQILREPVITQKQLAVMQTGQVLVMISALNLCYITKLPHYEELFTVLPNKIGLNHRKSREPVEPELFDIKEVVKERRRKEIEEQLRDDTEPIGRLIPSRPPFHRSPFGIPTGDKRDRLSGPQVEVVDMDDEEFDEMENEGLFGGLGRGIDLDALMRDIDAKIAELDAMEKAPEE